MFPVGVDNEASPGAAERQQGNNGAEAEHPAGAGVPGASGDTAPSQLHNGHFHTGF